MRSAVLTGTVERSTIVFGFEVDAAISRAMRSQCCRSGAKLAPMPSDLIGVLTETRMRSASMIACVIFELKKRFTPRTSSTASIIDGSKKGSVELFHAAILRTSLSRMVTLMSGHFLASMIACGAPTWPAPSTAIDLGSDAEADVAIVFVHTPNRSRVTCEDEPMLFYGRGRVLHCRDSSPWDSKEDSKASKAARKRRRSSSDRASKARAEARLAR